MFCVLLSIFLLSVVTDCSGSEKNILVHISLSPHEKTDVPLHFTLRLSPLYQKRSSILKAVITKAIFDSSDIVIHSEGGSRSYHTLPSKCFYQVISQHHSDPEGGDWILDSGILSLCESGIRGHIKAVWTSQYPNGAVYYLEPKNGTSANPATEPTWSMDSFSEPHRLRIVPIPSIESSNPPNTTTTGQAKTHGPEPSVSARQKKYQNRTTERQQPPGGSFFDSDQTINPPVRSRIRHKRATTVSDLRTTDLSELEPIRITNRPNLTQPYILELYLVVDEVLTASFRNNYDGLIYRVNMLMALVNSLFAPFNINIVVVQLEIWEHDRSHLKVEEHHLLATLAQFKRMHTTVRHDCLHALLGIKDEASRTRGKANQQTMCIYSRCVGYSRDSPRIELAETARTIAHELGHNFGLRHDTEECKCQGCIMATGVEFGNNILEWSPCSVQDLPTLLAFGMGVCLGDTPVRSIVSVRSVLANESIGLQTRAQNSRLANPIAPAASVVHVYNWMKQLTPLAQVRQSYASQKRHRYPSDLRAQLKAAGLCGNGQLDPGEECDCGSNTSCPQELRDCCDVERCRLRDGSECAGGPCCTIERIPDVLRSVKRRYRCRLLSTGTVCRNASGSCDLPEYCDGRSQWCPADVYKADGIPCRTDEGQRSHCIRGGCRTADGWCRTLWGDKARRGPDECFYENHVWNLGDKPDPVANCGKYRPSQTERWEDAKSWPGVPCQSWPDAECGRLWCNHRNEKAMLLGWIDSRTRVLQSGEVCSALVYDPVWPAADPSTWKSGNFTVPGQRNLNSAGVGIYSANTQDAGMVPDGTPCSHGLCYNGSCTNVYEIPSRIECDCRGQGICNNRGNCHCNPGFRPPNCDYGGDGGSIDSGPPPPDGRPKPMVVISLCILAFIGLPLVVLMAYWYRHYGCTCPRVIGVSMLPTESGLYKPFDRGMVACVRQCCRCRPRHRSHKAGHHMSTSSGSYPILAYTPDGSKPVKNGGWANGYCVKVVGRVNAFPSNKVSNGDVEVKANGTLSHSTSGNGAPDLKRKRKVKSLAKSDKPDRKVLISAPVDLGEVQSVKSIEDGQSSTGELGDATASSNGFGSNRMAKMWENALARNNRTQVAPSDYRQNSTRDMCKPIPPANGHFTPNEIIEPKPAGTVQISQPKLEAMTYQGEMCSLNEAMSTLKRGEKPPKLSGPHTTTSTLHRMATVRPPVQSSASTNHHIDWLIRQSTVNRSQSQRVGLSPRDISNPRLQNTTYTEALTDLETVRQQRARQSGGTTHADSSDKAKSAPRRLL